MVWSRLVPALQLSVRAAVAAGISLALARLLELAFPLYAMIAAVIVTDLSPTETRKLAWRRIAGTVLGGILGAALCLVLPAGIWTIALGIFAAMFLSHAAGLAEAARVAGYVCAIVLLEHGDGPWFYAAYRVAETLLGIGVAIIVSLTPKLLKASDPR